MCDVLGAALDPPHYSVFVWIVGEFVVFLLFGRVARNYLLAYRAALGISLPLRPESEYFAIGFRSARELRELNRRARRAIFSEQHNDPALESRRLRAVWLFRLLILAIFWPGAVFFVALVVRGLLDCGPLV
jgi:hypothetical protein